MLSCTRGIHPRDRSAQLWRDFSTAAVPADPVLEDLIRFMHASWRAHGTNSQSCACARTNLEATVVKIRCHLHMDFGGQHMQTTAS